MVTTEIFTLQVSRSAVAQASMVAPVVKTSSTSSMCLPSSASGFVTENISFTFSQRSALLLRVWVSEVLLLCRFWILIGIPMAFPNPLANISLWLYPLSRWRLGWRGTGIMSWAVLKGDWLTRVCPYSCPRKVPTWCCPLYFKRCNRCCTLLPLRKKRKAATPSQWTLPHNDRAMGWSGLRWKWVYGRWKTQDRQTWSSSGDNASPHAWQSRGKKRLTISFTNCGKIYNAIYSQYIWIISFMNDSISVVFQR